MKIVISNRTIEHCGIDTYVRTLTKGFNELGDIEVYNFTDRKLIGFSAQKGLLNKIAYFPRKYYRDQVVLPRFINHMKADIYHCSECFGVPKGLKTKTILTLHDIIPARFSSQFSNFKREAWINRVKEAISLSDFVITVSEFSKRDIIDFFDVAEEKISVVYESVEGNFSVLDDVSKIDSVKVKYNITRPYILTVGGDEQRKNNGTVKKIFENKFRDRYQLVMLGSKKVDDGGNDIITPGFVSEDDMIALYNGASVVVYVSLYEGFGLPVLEAMACGTPVITSNTTSIPEVAGNAAILVDPTNNQAIAEAIEGLMNNQEKQKELSQAGILRTRLFTLKNMIDGTFDIYKKVLGVSNESC
jgi:glycosyltransferase involved in cell wall biosynthesis